MEEKFTFFWSGVFSQWHPSLFQIDGVYYNTAEQFMMAEKARLFGDLETLAKIMSAADPREQKAYGREVKGFIKEKWDAIARDVVLRGSIAKYEQNPNLLKELMATEGTTLVEASPEDRIWGIGLRKNDSRAKSRDTWLGTNWLGQCLTEAREILKKKAN
jgi:hypothetical protein